MADDIRFDWAMERLLRDKGNQEDELDKLNRADILAEGDRGEEHSPGLAAQGDATERRGRRHEARQRHSPWSCGGTSPTAKRRSLKAKRR